MAIQSAPNHNANAWKKQLQRPYVDILGPTVKVREKIRNNLLKAWGWKQAQALPLAQDASFRQYFRLHHPSLGNAVLMDAPPEKENLQAFIKITQHLQSLHIRTPKLFAYDLANGFALMEDIGDQTFTRILKKGPNQTDLENKLYSKAITSIIDLQHHSRVLEINVPNYDWTTCANELALFIEWYLPFSNQPLSSTHTKEAFFNCWKVVFESLPIISNTLVLRDFHIDNLMLKEQQCVLLDYQDALIGSPAYDLVSLLEDARRDVRSDLTKAALQQYSEFFPDATQESFVKHYTFWGAQRHCKVAGIFARLHLRDNKQAYLKHIPRVLTLLRHKFEQPYLQPIKCWFDKNKIKLN